MSSGLKPITGSQGGNAASWAEAVILANVGGVVTIDPLLSTAFKLTLTANVTSLVLPSATTNAAVFVVAVSQDEIGGRTFAWPEEAVTPTGMAPDAPDATVSTTTLYRVTCFGNLPPVVEKLGTFGATVPLPDLLPLLADDNSTFNDEGTATTGWTPVNSSIDVIGDYVRSTKTAEGSGAYGSKSITMPPANTDYIVYGKIRASYTAGDVGVLWLLNGSKEVSIWFGSATANSVATTGAISICGTTGESTRNVASLGTGHNYNTTPIEFALQFSEKFQTLTCWFREADGRWKYQARVACSWFSAADIQMTFLSTTGTGAWIEFDYLTICRPNLMVLSDSIGEGKTLYSPNAGLSLTNDESTWMRHAALYPTRRNNLIVNVGVGGNTSAQMLSRVAADIVASSPKIVFLHASTNDFVGGVSQSTRTSVTQQIIDAIVAAGASVVLLNAMYGTSTDAANPGQRDYGLLWWDTHMSTLTGVSLAIDIMTPMLAGGYMADALTDPDDIHPNITGHAAIGGYIKAFDPT